MEDERTRRHGDGEGHAETRTMSGQRGAKAGMGGHTGMAGMQQGAMPQGATMPGHEMGMGGHEEMMRGMRERLLWTYAANIALGLWLLAGPLTFDYGDTALAWSDAISGGLIVLLGVLALFPKGDFWGRWGICLVGIWLLFAPLVFWSPSAAVYTNDTLVGALLIAFSVLIAMPGTAHHMAMMQPGPDIPPGWTYNPSSWFQRAPVIALGVVSFLISRYLAAYQLGYIDSAWDPFFGIGTERILDSDVSRAWPISDAGLGAVSYMLEALSGFMGSRRRWRTMPWMVLMFFLLVVPLGITSIVLVVLQPVAVGTWCTLCLLTALFMLIMIPLAIDEVVAMGQFLAQARREGKPLWRTFWAGGTIDGGAEDARSPDLIPPVPAMAPASVWGVGLPWNLLLSAGLGLWLMATPAVLGSDRAAADSDHLVGALVVTVAVIALAEVVRAARFLNVLFGVWIIVAPWLLGGSTASGTVNGLIVGGLLIALGIPRGPVRERYGGWNRWIV
ncbi:MAG: vitamin K epoxide reductase family protein [Dehalococcoidia bacterium]